MQERFSMLMSDVMRDGDEAQADEAIAEMRVFLLEAQSAVAEGSALSVAEFERMQNTGEMLISQKLFVREQDALMAKLEAGFDENGDLPLALKAEMQALTTQMMSGLGNADGSEWIDERASWPQAVRKLFDAIDADDIKAAKSVLDQVDLNSGYGKFDTTPLYAATTAVDGDLRVANLLLDYGADPSIGLSDGYTPLHGIAFGYHRPEQQKAVTDFVARLVAMGVDIEARTESYRWTPVQLACSELNETALIALGKANARMDPDAQDGSLVGCTSGRSTLEMVSAWPALARILIEFGCNPHQTTQGGKSILEQQRDEVRRNEEHIASIYARGKKPDSNEQNVHEGLVAVLELMETSPQRN